MYSSTIDVMLVSRTIRELYDSGYDGLDRRVYKSVSSASEVTHEFYYNGWNPVVEKITPSGGTTATVRYVWGKDLPAGLSPNHIVIPFSLEANPSRHKEYVALICKRKQSGLKRSRR